MLRLADVLTKTVPSSFLPRSRAGVFVPKYFRVNICPHLFGKRRASSVFEFLKMTPLFPLLLLEGQEVSLSREPNHTTYSNMHASL